MKPNLFSFLMISITCVLITISCSEYDKSYLGINSNKKINQKELKIPSPEEDVPIAKNILEIYEDTRGDIWFGTTNEGVLRLNNSKEKAGVEDSFIDYFSTEDGLCGKTVADIVEDEYGVLWFGTHSDMCRIDLRSKGQGKSLEFMSFERSDSVPKLGWGWKNVKKDRNGDIWINTHHGIFQYQNDDFVEFKVPTDKYMKPSYCNTPGDVAMYLLDSKGNIWFGTDGDGAYKYDPSANKEGRNAFTRYGKKDGLSSDFVNGIIEDKKGNIWFTCAQDLNNPIGDGGVCRLNLDINGRLGESEIFTKFPDVKGLFGNNIHTIYEDRSGNIWIGATGEGVYRYDIADEGIGESERFNLFKEPQSVDLQPSGYTMGLQSILEDSKGRMWCGFSGGLFRLEDHQRKEVGVGDYFVSVTKDGPWL